jgi:hypothetical protein
LYIFIENVCNKKIVILEEVLHEKKSFNYRGGFGGYRGNVYRVQPKAGPAGRNNQNRVCL